MITSKNKSSIVLQWLSLALLVVALAAILWQIVQNFEALKEEGVFRRHRPGGMYEQITPEQLRGWMTFRYVNLVFNLPTNYLKTALTITDKRYPNLSIDSWAKQQKKNSAQTLLIVEQSVKDFFSAEASKVQN